MQRHGDVQIQGIVVHHADGEEHGHHDGIVSAVRENTRYFSRDFDTEIHILGLKVTCLPSSLLREYREPLSHKVK